MRVSLPSPCRVCSSPAWIGRAATLQAWDRVAGRCKDDRNNRGRCDQIPQGSRWGLRDAHAGGPARQNLNPRSQRRRHPTSLSSGLPRAKGLRSQCRVPMLQPVLKHFQAATAEPHIPTPDGDVMTGIVKPDKERPTDWLGGRPRNSWTRDHGLHS